MTRDSGSRQTNTLLNLINHQLDTDKTYLYLKDAFEEKCQLLFNKRESAEFIQFLMLKLVLNTLMVMIIFMEILISATHLKNAKYLSYLIM